MALPYVTEADERTLFGLPSGGEGNLGRIGQQLRMLSAARCARASFASNQRGQAFTIEQDLALYGRLFGPPKHAGPMEHQATPMQYSKARDAYTGSVKEFVEDWQAGITHMDRQGNFWSGNFKGFTQNRQLL